MCAKSPKSLVSGVSWNPPNPASNLRVGGSTYELDGVPWVDTYDLERSDLVKVTPPWESAAKICRVVGYVRRFDDEMAHMIVVEVEFGVTECT